MTEWKMMAGFHEKGAAVVGSDWFVRAHCYDPVPVTVTEDPEGIYRGWIGAGETEPEMIQHERIYPIQFAYGPEAEERAGKGRTVRLRIDVQEETDA